MVVEMAVIAVSVGLLLNGSCNSAEVFSNRKKEQEMTNKSGISKYPCVSASEMESVTTKTYMNKRKKSRYVAGKTVFFILSAIPIAFEKFTIVLLICMKLRISILFPSFISVRCCAFNCRIASGLLLCFVIEFKSSWVKYFSRFSCPLRPLKD